MDLGNGDRSVKNLAPFLPKGVFEHFWSTQPMVTLEKKLGKQSQEQFLCMYDTQGV